MPKNDPHTGARPCGPASRMNLRYGQSDVSPIITLDQHKQTCTQLLKPTVLGQQVVVALKQGRLI
jgi:hypothetical protein